MKSIRTKITLSLILTVLFGLVASGSSSIMLNYKKYQRVPVVYMPEREWPSR